MNLKAPAPQTESFLLGNRGFRFTYPCNYGIVASAVYQPGGA